MSAILIAIIIMIYTLQSLFCRFYSMNYPGDEKNTSFVYSVISGIAVTLLTFAINGFAFNISLPTFLLGALNALALLGYNIALIKATALGSYAVTMIVMLFGGILIPLFFSLIVYRQPMTAMELVAIGVMLVAMVFLNADGLFTKNKEDKKPISLPYVFYCALVFVCNGVYGQLLSSQQIIMEQTQRAEMIMTTYFLMSIMALAVLACRLKKGTAAAFRQSKKSALFLALTCLAVFTALNMLMVILSLINPAILYTIDNGGVLVLSALCSWLFFKEKFTPAKITGIVLATGSILIFSIF